MQQFGMIVDVSHLNTAGVEHVLEITTRPIIATHSSARALRDHHRNLTDAQLTGIAARGGVVCVNFFAPYLHESDHTMDRLIDHLEHVVSVVGADHTGLGPDFVEEVITDTTPRWCDPASASDGSGIDSLAYIKGLEGPAGLPLLTEALVRRGWSNDQVEAVLGQSLYRFLRRELGPAPARPFMP